MVKFYDITGITKGVGNAKKHSMSLMVENHGLQGVVV